MIMEYVDLLILRSYHVLHVSYWLHQLMKIELFW